MSSIKIIKNPVSINRDKNDYKNNNKIKIRKKIVKK